MLPRPVSIDLFCKQSIEGHRENRTNNYTLTQIYSDQKKYWIKDTTTYMNKDQNDIEINCNDLEHFSRYKNRSYMIKNSDNNLLILDGEKDLVTKIFTQMKLKDDK